MKTIQVIVLLRHEKAIKNEQDRHGGLGSELAEDSPIEIEPIAKRLSDIGIRFEKVLYSPRKQCEQTAIRLGDIMGMPFEEANDLVPIHLGIIDGLSNEEVRGLYPDIANRLKTWRSGNIEINQLEIPGMDNSAIFFERGKKFVERILNENYSIIIVSTRSILVLLTSILLRRTVEVGGRYREIPWDNTDYIVFTNSDWGISFHVDLSSVKV